MLYGLGATKDMLSAAIAALPPCYSPELDNCLDRDNVDGLPKAQCDLIHGPYAQGVDDKTTFAMDHAINALSVCEPPSMVPYVGAAFAAGILLSALVLRR
jgi:hypothetical protein